MITEDRTFRIHGIGYMIFNKISRMAHASSGDKLAIH